MKRISIAATLVVLATLPVLAEAPTATASVLSQTAAQGAAATTSPPSSSSNGSLETAASRAGATGRKVAFSLIGLAFAFAAIVLAFKRDFRDAIGVLAIGLVAVLLASPAGVGVLQDTVNLLFG